MICVREHKEKADKDHGRVVTMVTVVENAK